MDETAKALLQPRTFEAVTKMGSSNMQVGSEFRIAAALEAIAGALCRLDHRMALFMETKEK